MLTSDRGGVRIAHQGGLNADMAVGGDAHADAGGADEDSHIRHTRKHTVRDQFRVVGIIDRIMRMHTQILHTITA